LATLGTNAALVANLLYIQLCEEYKIGDDDKTEAKAIETAGFTKSLRGVI